MAIEKLERMLDEQTRKEYMAKATAARNTFFANFKGTYAISSLYLDKAELRKWLDSSTSKTISVDDVLKHITKKYWDKHEKTFLAKARDSLIRDVKTIASIAKDYYNE